MSEFLETLFTRSWLPVKLLDLSLDHYAFNYAGFFAVNPALGSRARRLLPSSRPASEVLYTLIEAGNYEGLEMVLERTSISDAVIDLVLDKWDLSAADQLRLFTQKISAGRANWIATTNPFITTEARRLVALQAKPPVPILSKNPGRYPPKESEFTGLSPADPATDAWFFHKAKDVVLARMSPEWARDPDCLAAFVHVLINELGDASTPESRYYWRNLLALLDQGIDAEPGELLDFVARL